MVFRIKPSVRAAYRAQEAKVGASRLSLSHKLNGGETHTAAGDLWIAERNCGPRELLCSVDTRAAGFSRRQPEGFPVERLNALRSVGRLETGHGAEPRVQGWDAQGSAPWLRRIQAKLDQATRDGERGLYLLPPLPLRKASAKRVARFYRQRWPLETAFQPLEAYCHAAINSRATTLIMSGGSIKRWDSGHRQQYITIQTYRGLS